MPQSFDSAQDRPLDPVLEALLADPARRDELSYIQKAKILQFRHEQGWTPRQIQERYSYKEAMARHLRDLLKLPPDIQEKVHKGLISFKQARSLRTNRPGTGGTLSGTGNHRPGTGGTNGGTDKNKRLRGGTLPGTAGYGITSPETGRQSWWSRRSGFQKLLIFLFLGYLAIWVLAFALVGFLLLVRWAWPDKFPIVFKVVNWLFHGALNES